MCAVSDKPAKRGAFFSAFRRVFSREEQPEPSSPETAAPSETVISEAEPAPQSGQIPSDPPVPKPEVKLAEAWACRLLEPTDDKTY